MKSQHFQLQHERRIQRKQWTDEYLMAYATHVDGYLNQIQTIENHRYWWTFANWLRRPKIKRL